jgi:circadian clock protein KaiC
MDLAPHLDTGLLELIQIDPAEMSPGEFAARAVAAVQQHKSRFIVIDSLNAYIQSMPGQAFLLLHIHELLTYLNQQGVITLLLLGQHGLVGEVRSDVDLSYLSDVIVTFRFFEVAGQVRSAVACVKSRVASHERTIREFRLGTDGVRVGETLVDFEGILSGVPAYRGDTPMLSPLDEEGSLAKAVA